jgi:hypothetical protein
MSIENLFAHPQEIREQILAQLSPEELAIVEQALAEYNANPYLKYNGDLERIIEEGFGESLWSVQKEILKSVQNNQRTVVVTTPGIGKSDLMSLLVTAVGVSSEAGMTRIVTTASNFRQVKTILWPYIRRVHSQHNLQGTLNQVEWYINNILVADGFSAADKDEDAVRGIHNLGRVMVMVDEGGGISKSLGRALNGLLTTKEDRIIVSGNPPTDTTDTWFEEISNSPEWNVITVPYTATPNFTGEVTPICKRCPARVAQHTISKHLTSQEFVRAVKAQYAEDDPYVQAALYARFPSGNTAKAIPMSWLEKAMPIKNVVDLEWKDKSERQGEITLGIDIASDGGDEFVIAKRDGWHGSIIHRSSGRANENAVDVAGICLTHIITASKLHEEREIRSRVKVKIDAIGLGWGVVSILKEWVKEQRINAEIVPVNVAEKALAPQRFKNQRSELWWNMRELLQEESVEVTLDIDDATLRQLNGPAYSTDTAGRIIIESKKDMKDRGTHSPDRAEALLLAFYQPPTKTSNVAPIVIGQKNVWKI